MAAVLSAPGPIALRAVGDAEANVGVVEVGGENRGKAVETYLASVGLGPGNPWCAAFVNYRLREAAKELERTVPTSLPKSGYCPDWQAWAKAAKLWIPVADAKAGTSPAKRGDLVLFYFSAKGRVAHVGFVTEVGDGYVKTVEGNTGDGSGVNREGDGVYRRVRPYGALGAGGGFIRLGF